MRMIIKCIWLRLREKNMLRDFLLLENYFGEPDSIQAIDDVVKHYGFEKVRDALHAGHLSVRTVFLAPGRGRTLCRLSESGRKAAQDQTV